MIEISKQKTLKKTLKGFKMIFAQSQIYNFVTRKLNKTFSKLNTLPYAVDYKQIKTDPEYLEGLLNSTYFVPKKGPIFQIACGRITMSNKDIVKNTINLVYEFIPQILVQSLKNSTVKKICLCIKGSKDLPLYENDFVVEMT